MIKILGTTHLDSKEAIEGMIKDFNPDIICLELCDYREHILVNQLKQDNDPKDLLGKITNSIKEKAEQEGVDYGSDQKTALNFARENSIKYYLVDMPILKTQELFSKIPREEQLGFQQELITFQQESIKQEINEDEVLLTLKEKYPIAFEFLVNMRNLFISKNILKVMKDNPHKDILVILGKAHAKQVEVMIQ